MDNMWINQDIRQVFICVFARSGLNVKHLKEDCIYSNITYIYQSDFLYLMLRTTLCVLEFDGAFLTTNRIDPNQSHSNPHNPTHLAS